jgi:hypothetical protein
MHIVDLELKAQQERQDEIIKTLRACGIGENVDIRVNLYKRGHPHLRGETFINRSSFVVNVYKGSHATPEEVQETLEHELKHVRQVLDGRLQTNKEGKLVFDGELVTDTNKPQERDLEK